MHFESRITMASAKSYPVLLIFVYDGDADKPEFSGLVIGVDPKPNSASVRSQHTQNV